MESLGAGSSKSDKVNVIIQVLRRAHMSFGELIRAWIECTPGAPTGKARQLKARQVLDIIWDDDMLPLFEKTDTFQERVTDSTVKVIQLELGRIQQNTRTFGRYDPSMNIEEINFKEVYNEIEEHGPRLLRVIEGSALAQRADKHIRKDKPGRVVTITSILSLGYAQKSANCFARVLGIYLHGSGVRRRVISTLQGLGLVESYQTIHQTIKGISELSKASISCLKERENICVVYDNFDYQEQVHHQVIGSNSVLHHFTTGKVFCGRDIPSGGLQQDMVHNDVRLKITDIIAADGIQHDDLQIQISKFLIFDAIRSAFSEEIRHLDSRTGDSGEYLTTEMPKLEILPPEVTYSVNLGPINAAEGTIAGNYDVLRNIFLQQLSYNREADFLKRLFLVFGDQLTVMRIRSIQSERREEKSAYERFNWLMPVPGFFHLKMNLLYSIGKSHRGDDNSSSNKYSTLSAHIQALHRRNIPPGQAPFHHMEELIIHSFKARIVALFLLHINERTGGRCDISDMEQVSAHISSLSSVEFSMAIESIYAAAFSRDIRAEANSADNGRCSPTNGKGKESEPAASCSTAKDEEFINHVRYLQEVETYCTLKYAIKHADVGLLQRILPRCLLYFHGSGATNYALEMLHLWRLLSTDACEPPLRRAILVNGLINLRGQEDSWLEIDRHNEHLNLELKELLHARRNGTFDVKTLFDYCLPSCKYITETVKSLEGSFGNSTIGTHTTKDATADIRFLADILKDNSMVYKKGRSCQHRSLNLMSDGSDRLHSGALKKFNTQFKQVDDKNGNRKSGVPLDFDMFNLNLLPPQDFDDVIDVG